jgi:peptidoglycan/xylan/chitin deacetylase (PgdA/CDA1 family)
MADARSHPLRQRSAAGDAPNDNPWWLRLAMRLLSPPGGRGRLTIVLFHRVTPAPDPLFPGESHAESFRERMQWLKAWFNIIALDEAIGALARGTLPERALAITFDDGYADNATVALPILRALGLHATFFVSTGFLDGENMWNDVVIEAVRGHRQQELDLSALGLGVTAIPTLEARRAAISALLAALKYRSADERQGLAHAIAAACGASLSGRSLMLNRDQLRELAASGMGIGAHTVTHPILANLDAAAAESEIAESRDTLEGLLRQPVGLFAYPNGKPGVDYRALHVEIVRRLGFAGAVTTAWGAARPGDSVLELPRFTPWDRTVRRYGLRLARNLRVRAATAAA